MSKTENLQKLGMFLLLWLVLGSMQQVFAQRGGFSPDRIFEYMDQNKDGRLDSGEIDNSRGPMKDMLKSAGVDYRKGLDMKSFSNAFEKARQQREAESSNRDSGRGGDDRDRRAEYEKRRKEEEAKRSSESSKKSPAKSVPVIRKKDPVTVQMPATFVAGDQDTDGQIGFYEWKKWKRDSISDFVKYDHNGDGFLTPRELAKGPSEDLPATVIAAVNGVTAAPVPPLSGAPPAFARPMAAPPLSLTSESIDENGVAARRAESMFRLLDKDKNDSLSGEEWNRSKTLKPLFEKGGIDLSKPMAKGDFVSNYIRLSGT